MKNGTMWRRCARVSQLLALALIAIGCGSSDRRSIGASRSELTPEQQAVLGFENPTTDWSSPSGTLSESSVVSQGNKALAVVPSGWTEITSVPLSSLGAVDNWMNIDVFVPSTPSWGEIHLVLVAPSVNMWWTDLGTQNLVDLPTGRYSTVSFPLQPWVRSPLEGTYTDLRIKVILNAPPLDAPYSFDNIHISATGGGGGTGGSVGTGGSTATGGTGATGGTATGGGPGSAQQLSLVIPSELNRGQVVLSASEHLKIDSRVEIGQSGTFTNVAGLGAPGTQLDSSVAGHTNVYGLGSVWIGSQAKVDGFVRSEGAITNQDASVQVLGAEQQYTLVSTRTYTWRVTFPSSLGALDVIERGTSLPLAPGGYQALNIHGGSVSLHTGTYFFDSFDSEPDSQVELDTAAGPIFIYVKSSFMYKGGFVQTAGAEGSVLVGYLGTSDAFLQAPFVGTIVAPNAKIALERPTSGQHKGGFYGKEIEVASNSQILPLTFDWTAVHTEDQPPNSDGDKLPDPQDACPLDPNKTEPMICGCGRPETDSDLDKIPNCIDFCPNDPTKSEPGACGCSDQHNLQPAGTPCIVEVCSGSQQQSVCDGAGHCGVPDCDPIPNNCFYRTFRDSVYWFCTGPVTWEQAESYCNQEPERHLVKIDDRIENQWIASVLGGAAWLGGNDLSRFDSWFWSANQTRNGTLFWLNGLPVRRYTNWQPGTPGFTDCLTMQQGGKWSDADCTTAQGFVCEQPVRHLPPKIVLDKCHFFPGLQCPSGGSSIPSGPCVEETDAFPSSGTQEENKAQMDSMAQQCTEKCPTETTSGCPGNYCTGFAAPPPADQSCNPFSDQEKVFCDLADFDPNASCSVENPSCPSGLTCGKRYECAALDSNYQPTQCSADSDCGSGQYCSKIVPFCIDPNKHDACADKNGDQCVGQCVSAFACGHVNDVCAVNDDGTLLQRCSDTLLCSHDDPIVTDPTTDPDSNLDHQDFPADTFFPEPVPTTLEYPTAKPPNCGGDGEPACHYGIGEHPWCQYTIDPSEQPAGRSVSDSDPAFGNKQGTTGQKSGPIRFDFDPNLSLNYDVGNPLPFGDSEFSASAEASATASAHFSLFGAGGDVTILDALARVQADRCGLDADARLKLFGHDFLPTLLPDTMDAIGKIRTSDDAHKKCTDAVDQFKEAVNRVQKALRDAQELIRQEHALVLQGKRFSPDLCHQLLETGGKGVPADFPSAGNPFTGCGNLSPEDTINLFVQYYREQAYKLSGVQAAIADSLPIHDPVQISFLPNADDAIANGTAQRETQQIVSLWIMIGPVPVNLSIEAFVEYGIAGTLSFSLTPDQLPNLYINGGHADLADVDATVTPFAGAGVSLFVGVGFSFGPLSAKFGIAGDVSLGVVSLPIYAGAGIGVEPEIDERPLPSDLQGMIASTNTLFPTGLPKKFRFDAHYRFGANASIHDILSGSIYAKLRIKFAFFKKTWTKQIASFSSPLPRIDLNLVGGQDQSELADDWGALGGGVRQPVPFVDLASLDTPPALPPQSTGGSGGGGGTTGSGGAAGTAGAATGGAPVSLLVAGDPRYVDFDAARVEKFFFDGYCKCSDSGGTCTSPLDCCSDGALCLYDDATQKSTCQQCIPQADPGPVGALCTSTAQCCQPNPSRPTVCFPYDEGPRKHCQACLLAGEYAPDDNNDGIADNGECCPGLHVFHGPSGETECSGQCRDKLSCNVDSDCCSNICTDHQCSAVPQ